MCVAGSNPVIQSNLIVAQPGRATKCFTKTLLLNLLFFYVKGRSLSGVETNRSMKISLVHFNSAQ